MTDQQQRIGSRFAKLDLVLVGPMALPGLSHILISIFIMADGVLGLKSPLAQITETGIMFVNIVGVLAVMWAIARLRVVDSRLMAIDAVARMMVGLLLLYYWANIGPSVIMIVFLVSEFGGAIVQFASLKRPRA